MICSIATFLNEYLNLSLIYLIIFTCELKASMQKYESQKHRRRLLILAGGAETRNEKQLHTNFSKLSVKKAQFGSLINNVLYPIH